MPNTPSVVLLAYRYDLISPLQLLLRFDVVGVVGKSPFELPFDQISKIVGLIPGDRFNRKCARLMAAGVSSFRNSSSCRISRSSSSVGVAKSLQDIRMPPLHFRSAAPRGRQSGPPLHEIARVLIEVPPGYDVVPSARY